MNENSIPVSIAAVAVISSPKNDGTEEAPAANQYQ